MPYLQLVLGAASGAYQGASGAKSSNKQRQQTFSAYGALPKSPDLENEYLSGYTKQIGATPQLLQMDRALRAQYGAQDAQAGVNTYANLLPQYATANLSALKRVDPQFLAGRDQLYQTVSGDLANGSSLGNEYGGELEQYLRGGQSARGNYLGNANASAEAFGKGQAGLALKQQRIGNMEAFLSGPSPEDKFASLAGAGAPALTGAVANQSNPGFSYIQGPQDWGQVYMNAAQNEFGNNAQVGLAQANAYANAPQQQNPWLSALTGAFSGIGGAMGGGES